MNKRLWRAHAIGTRSSNSWPDTKAPLLRGNFESVNQPREGCP